MDIFQFMKIDDVIQLTACDDALPIQFYLKTSVIGLLFITFDYNGVIWLSNSNVGSSSDVRKAKYLHKRKFFQHEIIRFLHEVSLLKKL